MPALPQGTSCPDAGGGGESEVVRLKVDGFDRLPEGRLRHASFCTIRKFLRDVMRVDVSRGYLAKSIGKVSLSLAESYAELFERLPDEAVLNIDETGHKENGQRV